MLDLPILTQRKKITHLDAIYWGWRSDWDKSLSKEERLLIVDQCLEFNYKVYIVPLITDWESKRNFQKVKKFQIEDLLERNRVLDSKSISKQLKDKTILVTGAAGSIGSEIVRQVLRFNLKRIIVLDQAETPCIIYF
jgi:FlaA1/EpsC-like NDP-sugar epimerase